MGQLHIFSESFGYGLINGVIDQVSIVPITPLSKVVVLPLVLRFGG